ncbi:hypothetical protein PPL_03594 [Heterostelium album PN500]|uniref:Ribosomal protein S18 n=1 Tax=Heterostelium pallidum (strain ATCC 26659 / Pp 5 / PN500) TaxID=670386 RepID=D3B581_HETP5|nr:hypothetical protein PPL_03594 [Heterostelium album PN500]EFA83446.1 hypothetical protein PPL_03594 [Heterostelium album PN500]|eukprot:XP_020435563.1 hypothetical protein PPL_03594 [Heterostelium album PN500]
MQSSLSILNRFTRQCLSASRSTTSSSTYLVGYINGNSIQTNGYCSHKKKHHHHGMGTSAKDLEEVEDAAAYPIQMRRADLLKKMDAREQQEAKQFEQDELEEIEEDEEYDEEMYEQDNDRDDDDNENAFDRSAIKEKLQLRRKKLAIEDELESIGRFGSGHDNKFHSDVLSVEQLERAVFGEDGKVIPPENRLDILEKERIHEEMLAKAEEVGAENIEKYRVNPMLEEMRAKKAAKAVEDKSSTEYLLRHITKLERQGVFDDQVTRSPTTGKEVVGNKKFPKCLLCFDYGWKVEPMNVPLLSIYLNNDGDILPRYITGNCLKHQKKIARTIKQAKHLGLYSYKKGTFTIYDPNVVPPTPKEDVEYDKWFRGDFTDKDWIGDESIEEVDDFENPIDVEKEKLKQKESIMLDMGVSEHEADQILAGKFFKIKDTDSK